MSIESYFANDSENTHAGFWYVGEVTFVDELGRAGARRGGAYGS